MRRFQFTSKSTFIGIALIYLFVANLLFIQRKKVPGEWTNLNHDSGIYYAYLPAMFIKKDVLWTFMEPGILDLNDKSVQYWAQKTKKGGWIPKMTIGKAFMDLPFFFIADAYVSMFAEHDRNGFSPPYQYAILCATIFYALFGLFLLRSVLLHFFSDRITALTLLGIALATNLYIYSTHESGMSHPHSFFLLTAAIYLALKWQHGNKLKISILLGVVCALLVLIRPINIILLFPLPFFAVFAHQQSTSSWSALKTFFLSKSAIAILISGIIIVFPQLLFWKIQSGNWLFYSYGEEGFFFSNPQIIKGLFSFRKGWLVYTPIMIFALIGMFFFLKQNRKLGVVILIVLPIFLYVTFSWWCWWYGGGFSARTMIDFYPFLAFGLAAMIVVILSQKQAIKRIALVLFVFLIGLNMFQSFQYKIGILHADAMNWKIYKGIFMKDKRFDKYHEDLSLPDYENQKKYGFEKSVGR